MNVLGAPASLASMPSRRRVMGGAALLVALLFGARAEAACDDGVRLFPLPGATVPTNAQFLLEGVLGEQERVTKLVGSSELLLKGGPEPVPVVVERGWASTMNRVAVRLKPRRALQPNTEYTLTLEKALPGVKVLNDAGDNLARWRTGPSPDAAAPRFATRPAVSEGFYQRTRDGLARSLKLRTQVNEVGPAYLVVSMQRARGPANKQQYPVPLDGEVAVLGHDACSGGFGFDDGRAYKVTVELFDAAGNTGPKPASLELSAPRPSAADLEAEKR